MGQHAALQGVALVPGAQVQEQLVEFRARFSAVIGGPPLGLDTNVAHLTLFQAPLPDGGAHADVLAHVAAQITGPGRAPARFTGLARKAGMWAFAHVSCSTWLDAAARVTAGTLAPSVVWAAVDVDDPMDGHTVPERRSQASCGYRYAGAAFLPHVTLGLAGGHLPVEVVAAFDAEFVGVPLAWSELVCYRAGPFGTLVERTASVPVAT